MDPILTPREMAARDRAAIEAGAPEALLVERAGGAVARSALRLTGGAYGRRVVVACGKGSNGADGRVAARELRRAGVRPDILLLDAGIDRDRARRALARADLVVDAMYGTGFRGELTGDAAWIADRLASGPPVLSVDIPSGVDGLTGAVASVAVRAVRTVTFAAHKPGLWFQPGGSMTGEIEVVDIGVPVGDAPTGLTAGEDVARWLPERAPGVHKWSAGGLLVVGGSQGMTGAPLLVSHAAMRSGAGIVFCAVPGGEAAARASGTEVISRALPSDAGGSLAPAAADAVLGLVDRFRALALGPGLGPGREAAAVVRRLVGRVAAPVVLDADGLRALEGDLGPLRDRQARGLGPAVLTPHDGEFRALTGEEPGPDRAAAARDLAARTGAVVLLKGPSTVVADPGGRVALNGTGGPWLATAGAGDVLSGIVGAFLARGVAPWEAAAAAAWVHGRAADVAGHGGLVAGDLVDALRRVPEVGGPPSGHAKMSGPARDPKRAPTHPRAREAAPDAR